MMDETQDRQSRVDGGAPRRVHDGHHLELPISGWGKPVVNAGKDGSGCTADSRATTLGLLSFAQIPTRREPCNHSANFASLFALGDGLQAIDSGRGRSCQGKPILHLFREWRVA